MAWGQNDAVVKPAPTPGASSVSWGANDATTDLAPDVVAASVAGDRDRAEHPIMSSIRSLVDSITGNELPAINPNSNTPDSYVSTPAAIGRQFVAGGGDVMNAVHGLAGLFNPSIPINEVMATRQLNDANLPAAIKQGIADQINPAGAASRGAQQFGNLGPNEQLASPGLGGVGSTVARVVPTLAAAIASGGGGAAELPAAITSIPVVGRVATGLAGGAVPAATMTGIQASNQDMSPGDVAKSFGLNLALAGLPGAVGTTTADRLLTGGAIGVGQNEIAGAINGQKPTTQEDIAQGIIGAVLGGAHPGPGGQRTARDQRAYQDIIDNLNRPQPEAPQPDVATYPVQPAAIGAPPISPLALPAPPVRPGELPAPSLVAGSDGTVRTTDQQNQVIQQAGSDQASRDARIQELQNLGLSPQLAQLISTDPRSGQPAPAVPARQPLPEVAQQPELPALPAPSIAVSPAGEARTSEQQGQVAQQAIADQQAALDATQQRRDLGMTPDVERAQAMRFGQNDQIVKPEELAAAGNPVTEPAFSFAGERAQTADRGALEQAQGMETAGRDMVERQDGTRFGSPEDTHEATGWHRGADGKWKFEVDDSRAQIKPAAQWADKAQAGDATVADVLGHDDLMRAYPDLADVKVKVDATSSNMGAYNPATDTITIRRPTDYTDVSPARTSTGWDDLDTRAGDDSKGTLKSVLIHEIQHAIQTREGFARGGSSAEFTQEMKDRRNTLLSRRKTIQGMRDEAAAGGDTVRTRQLDSHIKDVDTKLAQEGLLKPEEIQSKAYQSYAALAGETEARNTQRRLGMTAEERRAQPPTETEDVPRSKQIVRFNSDANERRSALENTSADEKATQDLSEQLTDIAGGQVRLTLADAVPDATRRALDEFDRAFGGKTVVVHNETPDVIDFQGVTQRGNERFVADNAAAPMTTVAAHEMIHQLRATDGDLYDELAEYVTANADTAGYRAMLEKGNPVKVGEKAAHEELVADLVGDSMADPEFLDRMAQRNPALFAKVAAYLKDALASIMAKLRNLGSAKYIGREELEAFRQKLEDVLERYATRQQERAQPRKVASEGEPLEPVAFSRKPSDDDLAGADMPHRNPGESQRDYMRRVMGQSKAEIKEAMALAKYQQTIGRQEFKAMLAKRDRALATADAAFAEARKTFDKTPEKVNLATIDQWENNRPITDLDAKAFFDSMKSAMDERVQAIQKLAPDALQQVIENYFPHIWEDSAKATKWYQGLNAKRPLEGNKSFLKQRTWGTIKEGMASGLKPVSTNPVDLALLKIEQMDKFIAFHEFRKNMQDRGFLRRIDAGARVPEGYDRIEDPAFKIAGGLQGSYVAPSAIAKDVNNYITPGLSRFGAWKSLRFFQNMLMSMRLGWSAFHAGFTTTDNLVLHLDTGVRKLIDGDIAGGLSTLAKAPASIFVSPWEGGKLNKQWLGKAPVDDNTAAVLDALEQGGAHIKMSPTEYNNSLFQLTRAIRQKSLSGVAKNVFSAVGEASSYLIHHKLVPAQKASARVLLMKHEMDRLAAPLGKERGDYAGIAQAMHPDTLKQVAGNVVNLIDDRLGQMNYDNQFWNKMAKELAQTAIGAVGWQVGTLRTVTGGVRDLHRLFLPQKLVAPLDAEGKVTSGHMGRLTGRTSYLVSLALTMGALGAITQYLLTGKGPSEPKDYFFPKTGNKNPDGSDERLQYPSYWQDHYKLATHPLETAEHKIHPSIGMLMEILTNKDYYGTEVRNQDDPWYKQAGQIGKYVASGFLPYSVTGQQKAHAADQGAARRAATMLGVTTAPSSVSRTPFQSFVAEKAFDALPKGSRTQAQTEKATKMHDLELRMRNGEDVDISDLSPREQRSAQNASRQEVPEIRFKRLSIMDKLRAYDMASVKEREDYNLRDDILKSSWQRSVRDMDEKDRQAVIDRINDL